MLVSLNLLKAYMHFNDFRAPSVYVYKVMECANHVSKLIGLNRPFHSCVLSCLALE